MNGKCISLILAGSMVLSMGGAVMAEEATEAATEALPRLRKLSLRI